MHIYLVYSPLYQYLSITFLSFVSLALFAQPDRAISIPYVENYSKNDYLGGTQNWQIKQLPNGKMAIANNDGVLLYDGIDWQLLKTPNQTIVRSIYIDSINHRIYTGAQGEFGYFDLLKNNSPWYSLLNKNSKPEEINDIWDISKVDSTIYFRTAGELYQIQDKNAKKIALPGECSAFVSINNNLILAIRTKGLYQLNASNDLTKIQGPDIISNYEITDLEPYNSSILIATSSYGIYQLDKENNIKIFADKGPWITDNVLCIKAFDSIEGLSIGTQFSGLWLLNKEGEVMSHLNQKTGLQNNTIRAIEIDQGNNIWLGTYFGLDRICMAAKKRFLSSSLKEKGAIYDMVYWNQYYYFASSRGLYRLPSKLGDNFDIHNYELVKGTEGECWGLDIINNNLYLSHNLGGFQVIGNQVKKITREAGVWRFKSLGKNTLIVGHYHGLSLYEKINQTWSFKKSIPNFPHSARILELDNQGALWVSHPYRGVFKITTKDDFNNVSIQEQDLENKKNWYVNTLQGKAIVSSDSMVLTYDDNVLKPSRLLNELFPSENRLLRIIHFSDKTSWFISKLEVGIIKHENSALEKKVLLQNKNLLVGGFENLFPVSEDEAYVFIDQGVLHLINNPIPTHLKTTINQALAINNVKKIDHIVLPKHEISNDFNHLVFHFSSGLSSYLPSEDLFSFKLNGFDQEWSEWSPVTNKEYTQLNPGKYTFNIKAKNGINFGEKSSFEFEILKPWFKSTLALIIFSLLSLLIIIWMIRLSNRLYREQNKKLISENKEKDEAYGNLQNEFLQHQVESKNAELANITMQLLQKRETISQLESEVDLIRKNIKDPTVKKELKKLLRVLNSDQRVEEDWQRFTESFDRVHQDFIKRLKVSYPQLTSNDLKLAAYLRLNLSTKEIAPLLAISVRGVEISRYRLRKKLALETKENLNEFMMHY